MNFLLITAILLVLAALQVRLPAIPGFGLHVEFLPALVAYGALTYSHTGMLVLALAAGFTQDALSAGPFGATAIVFAAAALLIHNLRQALDRELPVLQIGAGVIVTLAASLTSAALAGFYPLAILKISLLALIAAVLTPLLFFGLDFLRYQVKST